MRKLFKWIGILVGIFLLLMVLAVSAVVLLVNPNRFKPAITEHVSAMTGRTFTIAGDLSWSVFPNFGIKVNQLILQNPPNFKEKNFAEIQHATVSVKIFPLFKHKVESSGITLDGVTLHLRKDAKGNDNWHLIPVKVENKSISPSVDKRLEKAPFLIAIAGMHITHAEIFFTDEQKNQSFHIENLELHAKNLSLLNPFPVTVVFDYQLQNSTISGKLGLKGDVALNLTAQIFAFKNLLVNIEQDKYHLNLKGDVTADLRRETLQWAGLEGHIGQLHFTGNLSGTKIINAPLLQGHLILKPLDMAEWLKEMDFAVPNLQKFNPVSGDFDLQINNQGVSVKGMLQAKTLEINHLVITNLTMPTLYQNGVLTISPLKGDFYQGALTGTVKLEGSRLLTLASLNNFDASLLLKDLIGDKSKLKFSGIGHMSVDVTSDLTKNVLQNLNGKGQFGFDNGVLKGIDIANMINSAYAVLKKTPLQSENSGQTDFGKMTGTFVIKNGIVQNNDLLLVAPQFTVDGQGMLDLPSLQINYHLKTLLNKANIEDKDSVLNLYGVAIPILITGSLQNPQIGLDGNEVAKLLAGVQVKKVEMRIKDKLKGKKASELLNNLFGH